MRVPGISHDSSCAYVCAQPVSEQRKLARELAKLQLSMALDREAQKIFRGAAKIFLAFCFVQLHSFSRYR
jgi:hypothetical protein